MLSPQLAISCVPPLSPATEEQAGVLRVLAAILHIGNVSFEGGETARVTNRKALAHAAELMGCEPSELEKARRDSLFPLSLTLSHPSFSALLRSCCPSPLFLTLSPSFFF